MVKWHAWMILCLSLLVISCEQWVVSPDPESNPEVVFEYLWKEVNERYAFFEEKNLDWDRVGEEYRSKISQDMGQLELFELLADMLFELRDGHVNLTNSFNRSRNWEWFEEYPVNYNENIIQKNYLGKDYWASGPLLNQELGEVLYVNYRSFSQGIAEGNLQALMIRAQNKKGLIIDVRNNGGGSLRNAEKLASCFVEEDTEYASQRIKNGPGKNDFGPWESMSYSPKEGLKYTGPVVVLINRRSYSASTFFAQMMKVLPNVILVGDQTGGGGGTPAFGELPNGWSYRFSVTQTIDTDGKQLEGGVEPTIKAEIGRQAEINGQDSIIDGAVIFLENL
ncbi:MAG: S41 family peptidase [Cyclobacteriaceae bacterium]